MVKSKQITHNGTNNPHSFPIVGQKEGEGKESGENDPKDGIKPEKPSLVETIRT